MGDNSGWGDFSYTDQSGGDQAYDAATGNQGTGPLSNDAYNQAIGNTDPTNQGFPGDSEQGAYSGLDSIVPALQGAAGAALPMLLPQTSNYPIYKPATSVQGSIGGPNGMQGSINLGVSPMPMAGTGITKGAIVSNILRAIKAKLGFSLKAKAAIDLVVKFGPAALGLDPSAALVLMAAQRGKHRRGPHLYTVAKRIRLGQRYSAMLTKLSSRVHRGSRGHHQARPKSKRRK